MYCDGHFIDLKLHYISSVNHELGIDSKADHSSPPILPSSSSTQSFTYIGMFTVSANAGISGQLARESALATSSSS